MSIDDSGFESEDQMFYSDTESDSDYEILPINDIEPQINHLSVSFMQINISVENNPLLLQDHHDILQISEDLDQLLDVMEEQARLNPMEQHKNQMRDLETPEPCREEQCTIRGCICEENKRETGVHNFSNISDDFNALCDNLEAACEQEQHRTSTPIARSADKECQTETQEGNDEQIYDGEMMLMQFSNEQVQRMIAKHDKFREEALIKEQNLTIMCTEANKKCHTTIHKD
jgi:hypothetical protein